MWQRPTLGSSSTAAVTATMSRPISAAMWSGRSAMSKWSTGRRMNVTGSFMSSVASSQRSLRHATHFARSAGIGDAQLQSAGSSPSRAGSLSASGSSGLIRRPSSSNGKMSHPGMASIATGSRPSSSVAAATRAWNSSAVSRLMSRSLAGHQGAGW